MKIDVELAYVNDAYFHITGKNFGLRLGTKEFRGLKLEYDKDAKELAVTWEGRTGYIVGDNLKSYFPKGVQTKEEPQVIRRGPGRPIKAQVSGPHDHVFAGLGEGKVRL